MARTITEIQAEIIAAKEADTTLSSLTSTSRVAIWRLMTYIVAVAISILEQLYDKLRVDTTALLATTKPHTLKWYVDKAKAYQHGITLPNDSDVYETAPPADDSVLIIKHAATVELTEFRLIRIKVAKELAGDLTALTSAEKLAFSGYMARIKDAGVRLDIVSEVADNLYVGLRIYYDPLVLTSAGARVDGTESNPIKKALKAFLRDQPFNGLFILNAMVDALTAIEGVIICRIISAEANHAALPNVTITHEYLPVSGYLRIEETFFDANVTYEAHGPI